MTLPIKAPNGTFVQTERETHEQWGRLTMRQPAAAATLHFLAMHVGEHNAVVISQSALARMAGISMSSVKRAIKTLVEGNWIEVRKLASTGSVAAYVVNDRVVWHKSRKNLQYSLFSASVHAELEDQDDKDQIPYQEPLRQMPRLQPGERQLASGDGIAPPSEQALPGMDHDLPIVGAEFTNPNTGVVVKIDDHPGSVSDKTIERHGHGVNSKTAVELQDLCKMPDLSHFDVRVIHDTQTYYIPDPDNKGLWVPIAAHGEDGEPLIFNRQ